MLATAPAESRFVSRISISLPEKLLTELDSMVGDRGFQSRSQAINDMLHKSLIEHRREHCDDVMVGTITLYYKNGVPGLQQKLAELQSEYIDEVVSSLHIHLANNETMEVILVQGPARKLQDIADEMITRRGVISGKMQLIAAVMPPIHPFPLERHKKD